MESKRAFRAVLGWSATITLTCSPVPKAPLSELEADLQALVETSVRGHEEDWGAALHVDAPAIGLRWAGAAGVVDPATSAPMRPHLPVLVASNTKTFVSTSVLRLWEQGELGLDDPISLHLPPDLLTILENGGYAPAAITVRHLLSHTGGLFDYATTESYNQALRRNPDRRWTRVDQLRWAMDHGEPHGQPGDEVNYSDTGYILLGEILEQVSGSGLPEAIRTLVDYSRAGLETTWFVSLESKPKTVTRLAHQFWSEIDATTLDPSNDLYGGGGIASTVGDLAAFFRAVFTGAVFRHPETVDTMLSTRLPGSDTPLGIYRLGVAVMEFGGHTAYCHSGYLGTFAAYVPALDLALGAAVNQSEEWDSLESLVDGAIRAVSGARGG